VASAVAEAEARLTGAGRIVLRASGTEPLIRVMVEADDDSLLNLVLDDVASAIDRHA
jgi:phosphoglucosamine mutase